MNTRCGNSSLSTFFLTIILVVATGVTESAHAQFLPAGVRAVDVDASTCGGGGDGLTWATAYAHLQDALTEASQPPFAVTQIWVAAGKYYPDRSCLDPDGTCTPGPCDQAASFAMITGVTVFGGFDGTELDLSERDFVTNVTTLSGDLQQDDTPMNPFNGDKQLARSAFQWNYSVGESDCCRRRRHDHRGLRQWAWAFSGLW